jgi:hypothetical protein
MEMMMATKPLVPAPAAVECSFIIPAGCEAAWRAGDKGDLARVITEIARDTATFCATKYEQNLTGKPKEKVQ